MINNLREEFYDALNPGNRTPITSNQQCRHTQQQAHRNKSNNVDNLMSIIQDLKNEIKALNENKENVNPHQRRTKKELKYC